MMMVVALVWAFLLGGSIPIVVLWWLDSTSRSQLLLAAMTTSYLWCVSAAFFPMTLGPHYSDLRLHLIQGNLLIAVAMGLMGLKIFNKKGWAIAAGMWLILIWIYMSAISFVV